jgi:uncharacterized protein (DUF983 family)
MNDASDTPAGWSPEQAPKRSVGEAMLRGARGRCPHCGEGRLFSRYLKVAPACEACGEEFHHHRADDLPAYLVMFFTGHVVMGGLLHAENAWGFTAMQHALVWPALTVVLSLGMIQPVKGAVVGLQWALRMHGFDKTGVEPHPALKPHSDHA